MPKVHTSTLVTLLSLPAALTQQVTHIVTMTSTLAPTTVTLAAAASNTPGYPSPSSARFHTEMLNSTNFFRYLHPAPYLQYNDTLAAFAQDYSEKCTWQHNSAISSLGYGENLAKGYAGIAAAVDAWGNEAAMFDFGSSHYTGFSEETGHFSQLVWRGTSSVGCGWTDCFSSSKSHRKRGDVEGVLFVCNYFPAGNVMSATDDENLFFKQNVVPERPGGSQGFNPEEAGKGEGGPTGTETESVAGTVTASAAAVALRVAGGEYWGMFGSGVVVVAGVLVGGLVL